MRESVRTGKNKILYFSVNKRKLCAQKMEEDPKV